MNKRLIGQWYKEELGETLDIFGEEPLRMKISFSSSGFYHVDPNCVYWQGSDLCYEINDERFRMVYHVHYEDGCLKGYYTQFGNRTDVIYTKVSDTPEDLPFTYIPAEIYIPETGKSRLETLKEFAEYAPIREEEPYSTTYVLSGSSPAVLEKYSYSAYLADVAPGTDEVAFRLLSFVCDHFGHNGSSGLHQGRRIEDILDFLERNDRKVNCRGLAILLASLLRLNGIKARHITCMPYEDPFTDCHVVVDCLLPSGKRIMLDPTSRLYYTDKDGQYVSLPRLRELLIADEPLFPNTDASYNGGSFDAEDNRNYMIKNTFRFSRATHYENGSDDDASRRVELIPGGYDTEKFPERVRREFVYNDKAFWEMD